MVYVVEGFNWCRSAVATFYIVCCRGLNDQWLSIKLFYRNELKFLFKRTIFPRFTNIKKYSPFFNGELMSF